MIKIKVIDIDRDDTIHFQGNFSNGICLTTLDFYGYSDEFENFANNLTEFPKNINDKAIFKLGEKDNRWAYYLNLEAYCFDQNGQSALKIETMNNGIGYLYHESTFEIEVEPASLNRLGIGLKNWNPLKEKNFEWSPSD